VSGWPQIVLIASFALMSGIILLRAWPKQPLRGDSEALLLFSAMTFAAAFPFLVLERLYANADTRPAALPEAESLARLLRVPLLALVGGGISIAAAAAALRGRSGSSELSRHRATKPARRCR